MTTIAWDGKTLAADTLCAGSFRMQNVVKIFKVKKDLVGFSGDMQEGYSFLEWYKAGCKPDEKPTITGSFSGIVVRGSRCYWVESNLIPAEVHDGRYALGTGSDFAMAAMYCGKTAKEAVEIAIYFDVHSGGEVTTLTTK